MSDARWGEGEIKKLTETMVKITQKRRVGVNLDSER